MKNNKVFIALAVALIAIAAFIYISKNSVKQGTIDGIKGAKSDFAIKDTKTIDKIFMVSADGKSVTLTKKDTIWEVNGEYNARPDNVKLLLKTFRRIDVRSPVPKAAFNNIIKQIATGATKVEIYQGEEKPSKIYYVGSATNDNQGTYMILETDGVKSTVPFIMYIPGKYGYLSSRFFTEADQWRDAVVFKSAPENIERISVQFHQTPEDSYTINNKNGKFSLSAAGSDEVLNIIPEQLKDYVDRYNKIYYEMIDIESKPERLDSIISSPPFITIKVNELNGEVNKIVLRRMTNFRRTMDHDGSEFEFDVDRMYGYLNDKLYTYVQYATFDKITLPKSYFIEKK